MGTLHPMDRQTPVKTWPFCIFHNADGKNQPVIDVIPLNLNDAINPKPQFSVRLELLLRNHKQINKKKDWVATSESEQFVKIHFLSTVWK